LELDMCASQTQTVHVSSLDRPLTTTGPGA